MTSKAGQLYGRPWSEREYLVVLDAYFATKGQPRHVNKSEVQDLARALGRTPASVYMRMENFASVDPEECGDRRGLAKMGPVGQRLFAEWAEKQDHLRSCAQVLIRDMQAAHAAPMSLFEPDPVALPKAFGKYELLDQIGQGAFGTVYSCVDGETQRIGALKIIQPGKNLDHESLHRFIREIRALRFVNHANVVRLHDDNLETEKDFPAFVMDLAETNLTAYANDVAGDASIRPLFAAAEASVILRSMVQAIRALHTHAPAIIHRDVNPNNILRLPDGSWVLADFGLAKFVGTARMVTTFATRTQRGWGTSYYAAPEQYRDFKRTDGRTDIYALGVLMWELFTTVGPPMERQNCGLPGPLQAVFLRATEREPDRRFATVAELDAAMEAAFLELGLRDARG